jgi:hypothetical protein
MNHQIAILTISLFMVSIGASPGEANAAAQGGGPGFSLYFGDLHSHTSYSDAWEGTPWDAYQAAKDAGADFMATTDHVPFWNAYSGLALDSEEWADTLAAADYFNKSKKFVAMPAYETWMLGHLGEINVFNVRELPPEEQLGYRFDRLPDFYDWLARQPGGIGQFNHPYYMTDDYENYSHHTETRDSAMNIIEVWNTEITEDNYVMALDAGWHLMPSANSDTHSPDWITGLPVRTVLLAQKSTPDELYGAMRARRGYATLDENLRIEYSLNGEVMGSILASPTGAYTAEIHIEDPDDSPEDIITLVEIISDHGEVVASVTGGDTVFDCSVTLTSDAARYYYVRVSTASTLSGEEGVTAWTAPVWTGR